MSESYATIIIAIDRPTILYPLDASRIVLVLDESKENPLLKLPGGRPKSGETPPQTASRELREEIGFSHQFTEKDCVYTAKLSTHTVYYFRVFVDKMELILHDGDENGRPLVVETRYTIGDVVSRKVKILPQHLAVLQTVLYGNLLCPS